MQNMIKDLIVVLKEVTWADLERDTVLNVWLMRF